MPEIPSSFIPPGRRAIVRAMQLVPAFGEWSWRAVNKAAKTFAGQQRIGQTYFGDRMMLDLGDFIGTRIYHFGVWEPHLSAFIQGRLRPDAVFCDAGANIGYYSLLAARAVGAGGRVVAIEPSPFTSSELERNIAVNGLCNVRVVHAALSDRPCIVTLYHAVRGNRGATTTVAVRGFAKEAEVPALPLDQILLPEEKRRLQLIKIDVEGAEGPILDNLLRTLDQYSTEMEIVCELSVCGTTSNAPSADALIQSFAGFGFRAFSIPNPYDIAAYLAFRNPQPPLPAVPPLTEQTNILFSRQYMPAECGRPSVWDRTRRRPDLS
jgi:FkbM family methyltransferase